MRGTKTVIERMDEADRIKQTDKELTELTTLRTQLKSVEAERNGLKDHNIKLRAALCLVQEQEKRGYLSYCGVGYTKRAVDEAIKSTRDAFLNPTTDKKG